MKLSSIKICSFILALPLSISTNCNAEDLANCSNPKGKSYYPYTGLMDSKSSGWETTALPEVEQRFQELQKANMTFCM